MAMGVAATISMGKSVQVQAAAAALLCLVVLAASPRAALGNCRDDCMAACYGWPIVCQVSCASACYGEAGISTLSTSVESSATAEAPAASAPAPAAAQGGQAMKPSSPPARARGDRELMNE